MRRLLFPTLGSCPVPTDWTCRWAGCQAGRCWRSHALPRLQVRSSQTKLNLQLCSSYLLHTPDLGTFPTPPEQNNPQTHPTRAFFALPPVPSQNPPFSFLSLFLRHRARRRATRLLRDDSAKARGFLPSSWRTLKCPWRQKSSSGTVSPPSNSHPRLRATLIASPRQAEDTDG